MTRYWKQDFLGEVLAQLQPSEREALDVMSLHQSAFKPEHAQNLLNLSALGESEALVTTWEALSLAQYVGSDEQETPWYIIPNYVSNAISATIAPERKPALHRKVALSIAQSFYRSLHKGDEADLPPEEKLLSEVLSGLDGLFKQAHVLVVDRYVTLGYDWQQHYRQAGDSERANQAALALMPPLNMFGRSKEMLELANAILQAAPKDSEAALWARFWQGVCKLRDKDYDQALAQFDYVARTAARRKDLAMLQGRSLGRKAEVLRAQGNAREALNLWKESAKLGISANDRTGLARAWLYLAETQFHAQQFVECVNYMTPGLKLYEKGGLSNEDVLIYGGLLLYRAHLYRHMENDFEAIKHYTHALRLGRESGNGYLIAQALEHSGHVYMLLRNYEFVAHQFLAAIDLYEKMSRNQDLSTALTS